jgi:hypothetical protein
MARVMLKLNQVAKNPRSPEGAAKYSIKKI